MELPAIVTKNCKKNKDPTCNIRLYGTMKKSSKQDKEMGHVTTDNGNYEFK